jgi:hypothetical protein
MDLLDYVVVHATLPECPKVLVRSLRKLRLRTSCPVAAAGHLGTPGHHEWGQGLGNSSVLHLRCCCAVNFMPIKKIASIPSLCLCLALARELKRAAGSGGGRFEV